MLLLTPSRRFAGIALAILLVSTTGITFVSPARVAAATQPTFAVGSPTLVEGDTGTWTLYFPVTLSDRASTQVSIDFTVGGGSASSGADYKLKKPGTLVFKPVASSGLTAVRKFIAVSVLGETVLEPDETIEVTLSNPLGGAALGDGVGTGTIIDDDSNSGSSGLDRRRNDSRRRFRSDACGMWW